MGLQEKGKYSRIRVLLGMDMCNLLACILHQIIFESLTDGKIIHEEDEGIHLH